ncbi:unnamed protein product [Prunus brigantina]
MTTFKVNPTQILEGHAKRVTSLAFSNTLNVLVSSDFCVGCSWVGKIEKQIAADSRWEGVEIIVRYLHPNSPE